MKKLVIILVSGLFLSSCVSKRVYVELEDKYNNLRANHNGLMEDHDALLAEKNNLKNELENLKKENTTLLGEKTILEREQEALQSKYNLLKENYETLSTQSSAKLKDQVAKNEALLLELEEKERKMFEESERLKALEYKLKERSDQIEALQAAIDAKERQMQELKTAVSKALLDFEGNGLTVEQRGGKVYVSMENKLLFKSGSWAVNAEGTKAVQQLAIVLAKNPDIDVLIEGHTDNVPYSGDGTLVDNWDLSVKRATAIVRILKSKGVSPTQLTAAGRSEFLPVAENTSAAGKAKNRRIEIILTPNLDEISKLLNE